MRRCALCLSLSRSNHASVSVTVSAARRSVWAALICSSWACLWSALSAEHRALWAALNCCRRACVASAVALATRIARLALSRSLRTLNRSSLRSGVSEARLSLSRFRLRCSRSTWAGSMSSSLKHVHCALYTVQYVGDNCLHIHDSATTMFVKPKAASTNAIHKQNYTV